jgi:hypothetical protein
VVTTNCPTADEVVVWSSSPARRRNAPACAASLLTDPRSPGAAEAELAPARSHDRSNRHPRHEYGSAVISRRSSITARSWTITSARRSRENLRSKDLADVAATVASFPAGRISDRLGRRGSLLVTAAGVVAFLLAYLLFAGSGPALVPLGVAFALAGVGIGCAETAEHAAVAAFAPEEIRGSAFGLLATVQAVGNVAASVVAGCSTRSHPRRWRSTTSWCGWCSRSDGPPDRPGRPGRSQRPGAGHLRR